MRLHASTGTSAPLGATVVEGGVNFSLFSRSATGVNERMIFHLILNAYWEPLEFEVPPAASAWRRWIDTSLPSPQDIVEWEKAPPAPSGTYLAGPRSVVVLYAIAG